MPGNIGAMVARRRSLSLATDAEGNRVCKLVAFSLLLLGSFALFATGGYYLLSQTNASTMRDGLVEQYDDVVEAWANGYRMDFQQGSFSVKLELHGVPESQRGHGDRIVPHIDTSKDYMHLDEERHSDLLKYDALKYTVFFPLDNLTEFEKAQSANMTRASHFLVVPQEWLKEPIPKALLHQSYMTSSAVVLDRAASQISEHDDSNISGTGSAPTSVTPWVETLVNMTISIAMKNPAGADTVFSLEHIPSGLAQMTSNNYKSCRPRGGIHQNAAAGHHCTIMVAASRICLVAHKDSSRRWQIDMDKQGSCYRPCVHPCHTRFNGTVQYLPQRTASLALATARGKSPVEIVLRSSHDPFLEAVALTNGTLNFGPSGDDTKTEGIICLVFAFVMGMPAVAHFVLEFGEARRANKYKRYLSPDSPGGQVVLPDSEPIALHPFVTDNTASSAPRMRASSPLRTA